VARVVLTARLLEGARERALELSASVADPGAVGIDRLSVYLSESEVIFVIEGSDGEGFWRRTLDDPVRAAELGAWLPLFDGPLHRAAEVYHWSHEA
jgi:hypothetical protein